MSINPSIIINGARYQSAPKNAPTNEKKIDVLNAHLKTSSGASQFLQLLERIGKAASLALQKMGSQISVLFDDFSGKLGGARAMLTLARLPGLTNNALNIISGGGISLDVKQTSLRGLSQKMRDLLDAVGSWFAVAGLFLGASGAATVGQVAGLAGGVLELPIAVHDYSLSSKTVEPLASATDVDDQVRSRLQGTARDALLRLVKCVTSVVSGLLGVLVLAFGGPILPAEILLGIGLVSTIAAFAADLFKVASDQEFVNFGKFDEVDGVLVY